MTGANGNVRPWKESAHVAETRTALRKARSIRDRALSGCLLSCIECWIGVDLYCNVVGWKYLVAIAVLSVARVNC